MGTCLLEFWAFIYLLIKLTLQQSPKKWSFNKIIDFPLKLSQINKYMTISYWHKYIKINFFLYIYEIIIYTIEASFAFFLKRTLNKFLLCTYYTIKSVNKMSSSIVAEPAFPWYLKNELSYWL